MIRGDENRTVSVVNYGKPKYISRRQVYFFGKKTAVDQQLAAVRQAVPVAVVVPSHYSRLAFPKECAVIETKDPYLAFWRLGLWNFRQIPVKVAAVTGSAGKSTTIAMIASVLKKKYRIVATTNNLNTVSFLPTYLCRLSPGHNVLLLEMGMKSLNNIARQCRVVRPQFGAVTNVGEAHFGSLGGSQNILRAKQELVDGMRAGGVLFLNADDARSRQLRIERTEARVFRFGMHRSAHIVASNVRYASNGMTFQVSFNNKPYAFSIPVFGVHNVYNALAAIGMCYTMGIDPALIQRGLAEYKQPSMRLQFVRGKKGTLLINDAWNANPTAMIAGLQVLTAVAKKRYSIAVLGDMLELGSYSHRAHERVGEYIANHPVDQLVTVGSKAKEIAGTAIAKGYSKQKVANFSTRDSALHYLKNAPPNSIIYFKASRKWHFEKLVKALKSNE
ncbi:UDP-N-acetylmuramoyl-tripeptide--D-alanyl-D-alanine ligase [Numidum massiliense]|uniref:UDP-N-acetylmuramoyl-tripeptide--D-alanyl-D- alanine ligase n=1 Tax=Numidum massiliense TaxID=1522315 RepID=UPI0006D58C8C|nr:UDP-N-acetylmuramoyl-tripeptide--D-alanyl-D-alanine ligase [Numidum massiliense]